VKNKRSFGIINTLNILLWIAFLTNRTWNYYSEAHFSYERDDSLFVILGIFATIVFLFSFFCYKLIKTFRAALPLSDSSRLIGPVIVVFFTLLTLIFDWFSISNFKNYFTGKFTGYNWIFMDLILLALSITSTYLCIAYWIIRREILRQLKDIIADLGKEENS
jgi:hypothetical protein